MKEPGFYAAAAAAAAATAKSLQSCPTPHDLIDGSPPGFPVPGILQARTLEWVAISFSNAWKWKVKVKSLSRVRLLSTPWTAAHQAPPSMGFSKQEYWSGLPLPSLGFYARKRIRSTVSCEDLGKYDFTHHSHSLWLLLFLVTVNDSKLLFIKSLCFFTYSICLHTCFYHYQWKVNPLSTFSNSVSQMCQETS